MRKFFLQKALLLILFLVVVGSLVVVQGVEAGELGDLITGNLELASGELPEYESPIPVISLVIKGVLSIVVIIFFIMIVIAGVRWMIAGGNEETIGKSKKTISSAVIGVLVIMFAYAITVLVFDIILGKN